MTKKALMLAVLAGLVVLSGCCARKGLEGSGWFRSLTYPALMTVVLTNNTTVPLEVYENGQVVGFKDKNGVWTKALLPPGGTVSRGYYNYLGRRDVVVTVSGVCPPVPPKDDQGNDKCVAGLYVGTNSRYFYIYTDGQYHTEEWTIDYLRGPRGVY